MKVIVIGSGPGGYTAAFEGAARGWDMTLVENVKLGGVCLNHGCIPTKSLRASADALDMARRLPEYGIAATGTFAADPEAIQNRKNKIIATLYSGLEKNCQKLKIHYHHGTARIIGPGLAMIKTASGESILEGDRIIIATGSSPKALPGLPVDHQHILDSNDALELQTLPESVIIVGGGIIGCELACLFNSFGSQVTIVEAMDRVLPDPAIDADLSSFLAREMRKQNISLMTGCALGNVEIRDDLCHAEIVFSSSGSGALEVPQKIAAQKIILAVGRQPNVSDLGLADANIAQTPQGWIEVSETMETSRPGIYAVGDVLGPKHVMLAHVAAMEGMAAIEAMDGSDRKMDYSAVPVAIFTNPELASVGLTEAAAKEVYREVAIGLTQTREIGRAHAMGQLPGFCKLVADAETGKILGAHLAGAHSPDLIAEATLAIATNTSIYKLAQVIHAHPTMAEALYGAALAAIKNIRFTRNCDK